MSHRVLNALSSTQRTFGDFNSSDLGGWLVLDDDVGSTVGSAAVAQGQVPYFSYIPDIRGSQFAASSLVLKVLGDQTTSVSFVSPTVNVVAGRRYMSSFFVSTKNRDNVRTVRTVLEFLDGETYTESEDFTVVDFEKSSDVRAVQFCSAVSGRARLKITFYGDVLFTKKVDVACATTSNLSVLTGLTTIDGHSLSDGDRVLVKNQTDSEDNGVYTADSNGDLVRADDADAGSDFLQNFAVFVANGTVNGGTGWTYEAPTSFTLGLTPVTFVAATSDNILTSSDAFLIYDPFITDDSTGGIGRVSGSVYSDLPDFMRLDDENVDDLVGNQILRLPLRRFVESLCAVSDRIADSVLDFDYITSAGADVQLSKLTDPVTAEVEYLGWLASLLGVKFFPPEAGASSWAALSDIASTWAAIQTLNTDNDSSADGQWSDIASIDPSFFDSTQNARDQIATGFGGIGSGRPDVITSFLFTLAETFKPVLKNLDRDNSFAAELLIPVSSALPPSIIYNVGGLALSAGSSLSLVTDVLASGRGSLHFDDLIYPSLTTNNAAAGASAFAKSFVSDPDGYRRHLRLIDSVTSMPAELGGGVGHSHYTNDHAYFYGNQSSTTPGSVTLAYSTVPTGGDGAPMNLGGESNYEVIVKLSDVSLPTASQDTTGSNGNTPADWLYREKRLIACGRDAVGSNNDWAVYLVSGATSGPDLETRLMLIDGFASVTPNNYAVSDPIDFNNISKKGDVVLRVRKAGTEVKFFAQSSLFDDWDSNIVGESTFTPASDAASTTQTNPDAQVQILGEITGEGWANASAVSCSLKRFMLFNYLINFDGATDTSATTHAYFESGSTDNFGTYTYRPTIDVDFSSVDIYDNSFTINDYDPDRLASSTSNTVTVTVNSASSQDSDLVVFRAHSVTNDDPYWYFGDGDTLSVSSASLTSSYEIKAYTVEPLTGAVTAQNAYPTTVASNTISISSSDFYDGGSATYAGSTIEKIEIIDTSNNNSVVTTFTAASLDPSISQGFPGSTYLWEVTRVFPAGVAAYVPSQPVDLDSLHVETGAPTFANSPQLEVYNSFSVALQVRRFWTGLEGTEYRILSIETDEVSPKGLKIFYDGPYIKASFTDGTNTEVVAWEEYPAMGDWQWIVVRRDPINGLQLAHRESSLGEFVVADNLVTAEASADIVFDVPTSVYSLGEADADGRFGLGECVYFDRFLSDAEIELLSTQVYNNPSRSTVSVSLVAGWAEEERIISSLRVGWAERTPVTQSLRVGWAEEERVTQSLRVGWSEEERVTQSLRVGWAEDQRVTQSLQVGWAERVSQTLRVGWAEDQRVTQSLQVGWAERVEQSLLVGWSEQQRVTQSLAVGWSEEQRVSQTLRVGWAEALPVTQSLRVGWAEDQRVTQSLRVGWDDLRRAPDRVLQSLRVGWAEQQRVTRSLRVGWSEEERVTQSLRVGWDDLSL